MLLKPWLDRGFDLVNFAHDPLDITPCIGIKQRDPRAGSGGISGARDLIKRAIGDHAQNHRVFGRNMCYVRQTRPPARSGPRDRP